MAKADALFEKLIIANRGDSNSAYNRVYDRVTNVLDDIESHGDEGRQAIEAWLESDEPLIRFHAGRRTIAWNSAIAIPLLGRLLVEPLPAHFTGYERFSIRSSASSSLFEYFEIRNFDRNSLIEPLKSYGIDLPPEPEQIWLD